MNILITGSNGFVGSSLAHELGKCNTIIGSGTRAHAENEVHHYIPWNMATEECPEELRQMPIDVIIHAAACLDKNDDNAQLVMTNCMGTHRIYLLAKEKKVSKVIYISGATVIGIPKSNPITEEHEIAPQSMYLATKMAGELILNQLMKEGIDSINLRVPSPIGPGMPEKTIVPVFLRNALEGRDITLAGKGSRQQNYIDVRDIAGAIQKCIDTENVCGTFNIGAETPVSNLELARKCVQTAGSSSSVTFSGMDDPSDDQIWNLDSRKIKDAVGYKQLYPIEKTLKDMMEYLKTTGKA